MSFPYKLMDNINF